jgi:hypothetical protein
MKVFLPPSLRPKACQDLIRVGRSFDGGYLINKDDVDRSDMLVSFGISDDWSFEQSFCSRKEVPVFAFDGSIDTKFWLKRITSAVLSRRFSSMFDYFRMQRFFSGDKQLFRQFIGFKSGENFISFNDVMKKLDPNQSAKVYLKIDIEGWEYRILDSLIANAQSITGLAIEFHDVDLHIEKIKAFVDAFPLSVVHVHANNYSPVALSGIPLAIEITFSSSNVEDRFAELPHKLDQPNKSSSPDYIISFERQ